MIEIACNHDRRFRFEPARTALVVIDMQREFLDPQGAYYMGDEAATIVPRVVALTGAARAAGLMLVHTREGYRSDGTDMNPLKRERNSAGAEGPLGRILIRGEAGQDFLPSCRPAEGESTVDKPGFSAFHGTDLDALLRSRGVDHLIVCGVTTQCCVHSTLRAAVDLGYWCLTVEDCCAAIDPRLHDAAMTLIYGENHLFGWVARSPETIAALGRRAA